MPSLTGLPPTAIATRGTLVQEAVERLVEYDEWFLREVEKGVAAADRGELIDHEAVGKLIESQYRG